MIFSSPLVTGRVLGGVTLRVDESATTSSDFLCDESLETHTIYTYNYHLQNFSFITGAQNIFTKRRVHASMI